MNQLLKCELYNEIDEFALQTKQFINKELSIKDYKGYSGGFGCYAQRGGESFMLRLRMNQGVITKEKLKFICELPMTYDVQKAHFTTCQTIQLHDLKGEDVACIMREALSHDIVCRGGGGDYPRNVMCTALSGVDQQETFDVRPYAEAVGEYLLTNINKFSLPRKLKVAFSNTEKNETHVNFRDLGFQANHDGTFDVYCAGGLGNNPKMGVLVGQHVAKEDILYYVSTMILMFMEFGNYENRAKARTRYMQETLGVEQFQKHFQERLAAAFLAEDLKLSKMQFPQIQKATTKDKLIDPRIITQKQSGLYAVYYHPIGGVFTLAKLKELYDVIQDMHHVELRITPQQGCFIINCTSEEATQVLEVTNDGARTRFETSVACIGSKTCQVGLQDSQGMLQQAIQYIRTKDILPNALPKVYFSGCLSSCGTNQIGVLGFQGTVKVIDKIPYPAFQLSILGNDGSLDTHFGEKVGVILASDVCSYLASLAQATMLSHSDFERWIQDEPSKFQEITQSFMKQ